AQRLPERGVRLVERLAADWKHVGECLTHADFLRTLTGKDERDHARDAPLPLDDACAGATEAMSRSRRSMNGVDAKRYASATALRTALALDRPWPTTAMP